MRAAFIYAGDAFCIFLAVHLVLYAFNVPPLWGEVESSTRGMVLFVIHLLAATWGFGRVIGSVRP